MKQDYSIEEGRPKKRLYLKPDAPAKRFGWTWQATGAILGLSGGLIAIVFGAVFTILNWFAESATARSFLKEYGTIVFLLAIPLLILGAHCLDLLDRKR
jgi:hypothetical protein